MTAAALEKARNLPCWSKTVDPKPLNGGITNLNYLVEDNGKKFVVRIADDIVLHQVMRFNEHAGSRAAHAAGISPNIVHTEKGALVMDFIEGKTLAAEDVQKRENLERILPVIQTCHHEVKKHLAGPVLSFWVFHVIRDYAQTLRAAGSRMTGELPRLLEAADRMEDAVGRVYLVYGHNDLLPANFIDDGEKIWLIDFDYAGFNSPLFDLGGIASNCELNANDEEWLLEAYFDEPITDRLRYRYTAMKCASLLREAMWSMVSEIYSNIDFDYVAYTDSNLAAFDEQYTAFLAM